MNITEIIGNVAVSLPLESANDLPMIRQALNDSVDAAVKAGQMSERQANKLEPRSSGKAGSKTGPRRLLLMPDL